MRHERMGPFRLAVPVTRRERARGLLGRTELGPHEGLLFRRCRSVHTFGMRIPIDVVRLDAANRVLDVRTVPPGRIVWPRRRACHVIEVGAGRGPALSRALGARTTPGARDTARPGRT